MNPALAALTLILSCTLPVSASETVGQDLRGVASVIDGDTIEIHGARIRLNGIDAPKAGNFARMHVAKPGAVACRLRWRCRTGSGGRWSTASRPAPTAMAASSRIALRAGRT